MPLINMSIVSIQTHFADVILFLLQMKSGMFKTKKAPWLCVVEAGECHLNFVKSQRYCEQVHYIEPALGVNSPLIKLISGAR